MNLSRPRFFWPALVACGVSFALGGRAQSGANPTLPAYWFATLAGAASTGRVDGPELEARFNHPTGVAIDAAGNVYVSDRFNHTVRKIAVTGLVATVAGSPGAAGMSDGVGGAARFFYPGPLTVAPDGTVYVIDGVGTCVRRMSASGQVTTLAGVSDTPGMVNAVGQNARFRNLQGIALDPAGNLLVVDDGAIRRVSRDGTVGTVSAQLNARGVVVDGTGRICFCESRRIGILALDGTVTTLAGDSDLPGTADGLGVAARFKQLTGIALARNGDLLVADQTIPPPVFTRIARVSAQGQVTSLPIDLTAVPEVRSWGFGTGQLANDETGAIIFSDPANNVIRRLGTDGRLETMAGLAYFAAPGYADGEGHTARFRVPGALEVGPHGELYVADVANYVIRRIDSSGKVSTYAGTPGVAGNVDGAAATAKFGTLRDLAVDGAGTIYALDATAGLIRKISPDGQVSTFSNRTGNHLTLDRQGNLYLTTATQVWRIAPEGNATRLPAFDPWVVSSTTSFQDIVVDMAGTIYVTNLGDGGGVIRVKATGEASKLKASVPNFSFFKWLALDGQDRLYVLQARGADPQFRNLLGRVTADDTIEVVAEQLFDDLGQDFATGLAIDRASGSVFVSGTGEFGYETSAIYRGRPTAAPTITVQPQSQAVAANGAGTFSVTASGVPEPTYQWYFNGVAIPGATGTAFSVAAVQSSHTGDYTVVVSNELGQTVSGKATLALAAAATVTPPQSGAGNGGGAPSGWFFLALLIAGAARGLARRVRAGSSQQL